MTNQQLIEQIEFGLNVGWYQGHVYEIRIPDKKGFNTLAGYFNDPRKAAQILSGQDGRVAGIYRTLNPVHEALLARTNNTLDKVAKGETTNDKQVIRRRQILIDVDAVRDGDISNISASEAEKQHAMKCLADIAEYLATLDINFTKADSGNGGHLLIPIDLANDDDAERLVKDFLRAIDMQFSTAQAKVDTTVYNAARITKVYGTLVAKGANMPDRPHRRATVIELDKVGKPVDVALLRAVASVAPKDEPKPKAAEPRNSLTNAADDVVKAKAALDALHGWRCDNYDAQDGWLGVGMALYELGTVGLSMWESWSAKSSKYTEGACARKWSTFSGEKHLASLFYMADQDSPSWRDPFKPAQTVHQQKSVNIQPPPKVTVDELIGFGQFAKAAYEEAVMWSKDPRQIRGIWTGIEELDLKTGGCEYGYMASLMGPVGSGKTTLAIQLVFAFQKQAPVLAAFTEMPPKIVAHRMACQIAGVNYQLVRQGHFSEKLANAYREIAKMNIVTIPIGRPTASYLREAAFRYMEKDSRIILACDSGNNVRVDSGSDSSIYNTTRTSSNTLQEIAYQGAFVFSTWQVGRNAKERSNKDVTLMDAKGAGDIEADSAYVWGWDRPYYWYEIGELKDPPDCDEGYTILRCLKNRDGGIGPIELMFKPGQGCEHYKKVAKKPAPYPKLSSPATIYSGANQ